MLRALRWLGGHPIGRSVVAIAAMVAMAAFAEALDPPQAHRNWLPYLANAAQIRPAPEGYRISPVSDWRYSAEAPVSRDYGAIAVGPSELRRVWFVLEPQPGSDIAAHTFLLFELEGGRLLGLTIEARREAHESYSALRGLWNAYELAYVWASARDLLTRRAVMLDHEVFVYPIEISDAQLRTLFERLIERTASLEMSPRYYNTAFSNCTNELAKAAGLPWSLAFILTGTSDEHLFGEGLITGDDFETAHARSDVTGFVQELNALPAEADFDAAMLAELNARWGME